MSFDKMKKIWDELPPVDTTEKESEWNKILQKYSESHRHYHTLQHLQQVYDELLSFYGDNIPGQTLYALFYHDVEYSALRSDNEEKSAKIAASALSRLGVDVIIEKVSHIIRCTKLHDCDGEDETTAAFLDADMAILGSAAEVYAQYTKDVRKEFSIYPDFIYNRGRKQFVEQTLAKPRIFFTEYFYNKYEQEARINLTNELKSLL